MSSISKIVSSVAKSVDASDVSKLAQSQAVKTAVTEGTSEIGEALANGLTKNGTDVASTLIKETGEAASTQSAKKGRFNWLKNLFKNKKTSSDVTTQATKSEAVEQTADELQDQILELQKQSKKLQEECNKTQKAKSHSSKLTSEQKAELKQKNKEINEQFIKDVKSGWAQFKVENKQNIAWIKEKASNIKSWLSNILNVLKGNATYSVENKCFITRN